MAETAIFLQDACLQHKYIRSKDKSNVFERPERLRAVNVGISSAIARLESVQDKNSNNKEDGGVGELVDVLGKMYIGTTAGDSLTTVAQVIKSQASIDILDNAAVKFVHGDVEGDVYLEKLTKWTKDSWEEISQGRSEIPEGMPQGDLYRSCFRYFKVNILTYCIG
jgi:histone deacetylase HOS3